MKTKFTLFYVVFALCVNISISVYAQPVNKQDSLALVDLYKSTGGASYWYTNTNWLTKSPVATWYGITVTGKRVTGINLSDNDLIDSIPASIGNLANLTHLDLGSNNFFGSVPSSIGNLINLNYLDLNGSYELTGTILSSLGNLINLTYLDLGSNQFSGTIPSSMGNLIHLTHLNLGRNPFTGTISSSLGNLVNLTYLDLGIAGFSGTIPTSFGNLIHLTNLNLEYNQLSGTIPTSLGNFIHLTDLGLGNNQLGGSIPSSLGNLVNLFDLDLSFNQLSGSIPASLGNLVNASLTLDHNRLSGTIPSSLGNIYYWLDLSYNRLSGTIPSSIGKYLSHLNLSNNKLNGAIPSSFANLSDGLDLRLQYNRFTFAGMEIVAKKYPFAKYAPQAQIPIYQIGSTLSVSAGGRLSHNTYKWFRVTKTGNILVATIAGDSVFHPSQNGTYTVNVTNSVATDLTLTSETINYAAPSQIVASVSASSSENALQYKPNLFLVYPNPARYILHAQTSGKATLSLSDQSGKILLNTNINSEGSINISGMAAGLYYLRNNNTGAVQKVIIAR